MPKQRSIESRIESLEEQLNRLKTIKKIEDLQKMIPRRKRRK